MQHLKMQYGHTYIRAPFQLMLIVVAVLAVYYPIAFGDFARIDDHSIVDAVSNMGLKEVRGLFISHSQGGAYYRPVLFLSFLLDKYLFNLDPGFMHIHSILLHAINALLIFWLAYQLIPESNAEKSYVPLLSALAFGLHPIATEPVSWIAGRTDVLACTFILLSANCIIRFKKSGFYRYIPLAALFMMLGFLTKEVALAFLPGAFLFVDSPLNPESGTNSVEKAQNALRKYSKYSALLLGFGAVLLFFLLRHFAFDSNSGRIVATFRFLGSDLIRVELIFLQALGFYVKKIFFPFPLSFAITDVDPLYELLGVPIIVLCFLSLAKRSKLSVLFLTGIFLIIPSFVIAFGQMAWTSFAERYMYLPAAFIMVASVIFVIEKIPSHYVKKEGLIVLVLAVMAVTTFNRATVWKSNLALLKDTVEKNPDFYYVRGQYADELAVQGDIKNARIQYMIADEYNKIRKRLRKGKAFIQLQYWEMPELGLADLLARERKIPEAIKAYEKIIRDAGPESIESKQALNNVIILYDGLLENAATPLESNQIKRKLSLYSEKYYEHSDDANAFYWLGRKFLMRGDKQEALVYFKKAESKFSEGNQYKIIAQKFVTQLEKK